MQALLPSGADLPNDGRVNLNRHQLKLLRQKQGLSQEALSEACANRKMSLSPASIKRAESGKPVLYRTARLLAAFFGVPLPELTEAPAAAAPEPTTPERHALERSQVGTALATVQASGRGRLLVMHGAAGAGKSQLLSECAADARQRDFLCVELRVGGALAAQALATLAGALLQIQPGTACRDTVAADIQRRLRVLGLPGCHGDACMALMEGAILGSPLEVHGAQLIALRALILRAVQDRPLLISIDDLHLAPPSLMTLLEHLLPTTLSGPVTWLLASDSAAQGAYPGIEARLPAVARTAFHLDHGGESVAVMRADATRSKSKTVLNVPPFMRPLPVVTTWRISPTVQGRAQYH